MVDEPKAYNPLDYDNLTQNCVRELLTRGPDTLPLAREFIDSGVYALFYAGNFPLYATVRSPDASRPIYVGKAVPAGGRKGIAGRPTSRPSKSLHGRLSEHTASIETAANLRIEDFLCRYLVVEPLWIVMAEGFLIRYHKPLWNVCLEGFGNHDPGKGRHQGEIAWWDALHPGRPWAARLRQTRTAARAEERVRAFLGAPEEQKEQLAERALDSVETGQ
jgi:hypothetical protein